MTLTERLDAICTELTAVREEAEKCDRGITGAPGTRLRKATIKITGDLKALRNAVLEVREEYAFHGASATKKA